MPVHLKLYGKAKGVGIDKVLFIDFYNLGKSA